VLDDFTVNRVKQVFTTQQKDFHLFDEQLQRWLTGEITEAQRQEVERLVGQMQKMRENNTNVLKLADELSKGTIDKIMAKSDEELGLDAFMRMFGQRF
jgi:16S rRNA U1498 N3-methylase RsmE